MGDLIYIVYCAHCKRPFRPKTPRSTIKGPNTPEDDVYLHIHCMKKKRNNDKDSD